MTVLDWLIVAILFGSVLLAAAHGFLVEVFSLAGTVFGLVLAQWRYASVAAWYRPYVSADWVADLAGFVTILGGVVLLAGMAGRLARWALKQVGLQWFDRLLGAALGLVGGILLSTALVLALAAFSPGSPMLARSTVGSYMLVGARAAAWMAPAELRGRFQHGLTVQRQLRLGAEPEATSPAPPPPAR
jgi:membrane protein required for colicin V production